MSAEALRNRQLRQIDWRFFLAEPAPARTVCWAGAALADSLRRVSPELSTQVSPETTAWDLVVDSQPVQARIDTAHTLLRPGGEYAANWNGLGPAARRRMRRRLERAGFREVRFYWVWPATRRNPPRVWVRIDDARPFRWLARSRLPRHTFAARVRSVALTAAGELARRTGLLRPVWVLARKPGGPRSVDPPVVLLTGGYRSINKVVGLTTSRPDAPPDTVVKMPRTDEGRAGLVHEASVLSSIGPIAGAPRLLDFDTDRGVLTETLLVGDLLLLHLNRRTLASLCQRGAAWLCDLARATLAPASTDRVAPIVAIFEQQWAPILEPADQRAARALVEGLSSLPSVCEHRDFAPWNLSLGGHGELVVLDWESAEPRGMPALDLVYFLAYAGFFVAGAMPNGDFRSVYRAMLNADTRFGALRRACLEGYLRALELPTQAVPALGLLTWMIHARSEYQRLLEDAAGPPTPERLRRGVFWRLWQEEVRHAT